jgi:hypothetical protein
MQQPNSFAIVQAIRALIAHDPFAMLSGFPFQDEISCCPQNDWRKIAPMIPAIAASAKPCTHGFILNQRLKHRRPGEEMSLPVAMHLWMKPDQARQERRPGTRVAEDKELFQREKLLRLCDFFGSYRWDLPPYVGWSGSFEQDLSCQLNPAT